MRGLSSGQAYYAHPLNLTWLFVQELEIDGVLKSYTVCVNTYLYLKLGPSSFVGFDIILGHAFLRNDYASFDYGDYYPANHTNSLPFVQMMPTTDVSQMWQDVSAERAATLAELPP
ncbi:hypothetical protein OH76DRAFT_1482990 [Lentinus brumalis]|uniref:Peptidase A1 domain-containing protein n=1 Tax=Lentinus brumalis TaxID=2498619 RepID=A0A371DAR9_9APHY|nr:hypothetical protein OH76DRAFT_1482990 [Polyporus brumalis]